jgi:Adenylate and Guanylate cyclase catalytic domain
MRASGTPLEGKDRGCLHELPGADYTVPIGDMDAMLDEVEEFLTGARGHAETDRLLATVLFTDIVQSTERAAQVGDHRWNEMLDAHDQLARRQLARYRGRLVRTMGDGLLATSDGPARAIRATLAIQDGLQRMGLEIRGGLHTGEIEGRGEDVGRACTRAEGPGGGLRHGLHGSRGPPAEGPARRVAAVRRGGVRFETSEPSFTCRGMPYYPLHLGPTPRYSGNASRIACSSWTILTPIARSRTGNRTTAVTQALNTSVSPMNSGMRLRK